MGELILGLTFLLLNPLSLAIITVIAVAMHNKKKKARMLSTQPVNTSSSVPDTLSYEKGYEKALQDIESAAVTTQQDGQTLLAVDAVRSLRQKRQSDSEVTVAPSWSPQPEVLQPQANLATDAQPSPSEVTTLKKETDPNATLNIILFVASLLIVGAATTFIATTADEGIKVVALWAATLLFYGGGLGLYVFSRVVQKAALAFLAIGMALVPLAGMTLHTLGGMTPTAAWTVTSAIGLLLYTIAAVTVRHKIVSYVALISLMSLCMALSRTLTTEMVWLFIPLILLAIGMQLIATLAKNKLPEHFREPVDTTSAVLSVIVLLLSLPFMAVIDIRQYELLVGLVTLQYGLYFWQTKRLVFEVLARIFLSILLLLVTYDIARNNPDNIRIIGMGWLLTAIIQQAMSFARWRSSMPVNSNRRTFELTVLRLTAIVEWCVAFGWWFNQSIMVATSLAFIIIVVVSWLLWQRTKFQGWLYNAATAIFVAAWPLVYLLFDSGKTQETVLTWYYLAIGAALMVTYYFARHRLILRNVVAYGAIIHLIGSLLCGLLYVEGLVMTLSLVLIATYLYMVSWVERQRTLLFVANALLVIAIGRVLYQIGGEWQGWYFIVALLVAGGLKFSASEMTRQKGYSAVESIMRRSAVLSFALGFMPGVLVVSAEEIGIKLLGSLALVALCLTLGLHYLRSRQPLYGELAIYAGAALIFYTLKVIDTGDTIHDIVYAHIIGLAVALAARVYLVNEERQKRYMVAAAIITFVTAGYALSGESIWQLFFLFEQALLLVFASLLGKKWAVWWSAVAITLSLLYMLRGIEFLVPFLVGVSLFGYVIWRLVKMNKK